LDINNLGYWAEIWILEPSPFEGLFGKTRRYQFGCFESDLLPYGYCNNHLGWYSGICVNADTLAYVEITLNETQINEYADEWASVSPDVTRYNVAETVISHNFGTAFGLTSDIPPPEHEGHCALMQNVMDNDIGLMALCGIYSPTANDAYGMALVYPDPLTFQWGGESCGETPCP
jgi:hypothetical protein